MNVLFLNGQSGHSEQIGVADFTSLLNALFAVGGLDPDEVGRSERVGYLLPNDGERCWEISLPAVSVMRAAKPIRWVSPEGQFFAREVLLEVRPLSRFAIHISEGFGGGYYS